jgi:ribosome-associated toxin RatA of RatAB toxin-antitoxin module
MADRTESSILVEAAPADVLAVVADFADYPSWAGAVRSTEVLSTGPDGRPEQVKFTLDAGAIRDTYVLAYVWDLAPDGQGELSWSLIEANIVKAMDGAYRLAAATGGTRVTYTLFVDLRVPMLGMLRRKAEKVIIDTALNELKKRVEQ